MNGGDRDLEAQKRELLLQSERYRQALGADLREVTSSIAWVPRAVGILRYASPVLLTAIPGLAFLAGRKMFAGASPPMTGKSRGGGIVAKILMAVRIFQQVKPLWDAYMRSQSQHAPR